MWMLDTKKLTLKYFQRIGDVVRYAILSHIWQEEEVTFGDMHGTDDSYKSKKGWFKILKCCETARKDRFEYIWVDTCCIDKRSSVELSEAINSMYQWYKFAETCYAYLFDINNVSLMGSSSWFTRSWTLQELIAPTHVVFLNAKWENIGNKIQLSRVIFEATSIDPIALLYAFRPADFSIAQRMSWAASREATRQEDIAYSLLGLFEVNMPLLYGEGEKAFQRLQEEIMRTSNDLSIFACPDSSYAETTQLLAVSPRAFRDCAGQKQLPLKGGYTFNNAGISIDLEIEPCLLHTDGSAQYVAFLHSVDHQDCRTIFIRNYDDIFYRVVVAEQVMAKQGCDRTQGIPRRKQKLLLAKDEIMYSLDLDHQNFSTLVCPQGVVLYARSAGVTPGHSGNWTAQGEGSLYQPGWLHFPVLNHYGILGYMTWIRRTERGGDTPYILCFGYDFEFQPIFLAFRSPIKHCRNPLAQIPSSVVMDRYVELMSESTISQAAYDPASGIHTARGQKVESSTIYMPKHSIRIQLGISDYEPFNSVIAFNLYQCSTDEGNLAEVGRHDAAVLRRLFSTAVQQREEEKSYDAFMANVPDTMSLHDLENDGLSITSSMEVTYGQDSFVVPAGDDQVTPLLSTCQAGKGQRPAADHERRF